MKTTGTNGHYQKSKTDDESELASKIKLNQLELNKESLHTYQVGC